MNLESDRLASGTTAAVLAGGTASSVPLITLPYKGSKALLRIGKTWITSKIKAEIYRGQRKKKMIQYCKERYNWSKQVVEMVNWDTIEIECRTRGNGQSVITSFMVRRDGIT